MKRLFLAVFRKPKREWQRRLYFEGALRIALVSDYIHYRAEEWLLELERDQDRKRRAE